MNSGHWWVTKRKREKEVLLIGTVHRDPDGAAKLRRLLTKECPASVAVEVSPYALLFRRRNGRRLCRHLRRRADRLAGQLGVAWRRWGQIQAIEAQLLVPFEYRASLSYCRDTGATLSCLDSSAWSSHWIHTEWQQLLSRENMATMLTQPPENLEEEVRRRYRLADHLLSDQGQVVASAFVRGWTLDSHWQEREGELALGLMRLYGALRKGRLAYIGGWQHLLNPGNGVTLYEYVKHLQPRRVLLDEGRRHRQEHSCPRNQAIPGELRPERLPGGSGTSAANCRKTLPTSSPGLQAQPGQFGTER